MLPEVVTADVPPSDAISTGLGCRISVMKSESKGQL